MNSALICIGLIILIEAVGFFVFKLLAKIHKTKKSINTVSFRSVIKGLAERAFICFALVNGFPQALTIFAALKIATRIKEDNEVTNDFYLLGNLLSITMAIVFSQLIIKYFPIVA